MRKRDSGKSERHRRSNFIAIDPEMEETAASRRDSPMEIILLFYVRGLAGENRREILKFQVRDSLNGEFLLRVKEPFHRSL